jgi:hypothetical protein
VKGVKWLTAVFVIADVKMVSGYVPAPSSGSTSHDRGSSGWHNSGHGSAAKSRDYDQSAGSSSHWSGRGSSSVQASSGRADWSSSRAAGGSSSGAGAGSGSSFLSSATNILMGMGVTGGGGGSSSSRGAQDQRFDGYKTMSGSSTRRY